MVARLGQLDFNDRAYVQSIANIPIRQRRNVQIGRVVPVEQRLNFRSYRPVASGIIFI